MYYITYELYYCLICFHFKFEAYIMSLSAVFTCNICCDISNSKPKEISILSDIAEQSKGY